jgi:parvulin-like peptidyl-prolyl isomerase
VAAQFGGEFSDALRGLPQGQWTGPVLSGLGLHLVRVTARSTPAPPSLAKVRVEVENDWHNSARQRAEDAAYRKVLANYDVVIEQPK